MHKLALIGLSGPPCWPPARLAPLTWTVNRARGSVLSTSRVRDEGNRASQKIDEEKRMMAVVGETAVAEAANEAVISIEGNAYFPPDSLTAGVLRNSLTAYTCPWKGPAQYYDVLVGGTVLSDGAWSYPDIWESAVARVGRDFSGYVAFDVRQVQTTG